MLIVKKKCNNVKMSKMLIVKENNIKYCQRRFVSHLFTDILALQLIIEIFSLRFLCMETESLIKLPSYWPWSSVMFGRSLWDEVKDCCMVWLVSLVHVCYCLLVLHWANHNMSGENVSAVSLLTIPDMSSTSDKYVTLKLICYLWKSYNVTWFWEFMYCPTIQSL